MPQRGQESKEFQSVCSPFGAACPIYGQSLVLKSIRSEITHRVDHLDWRNSSRSSSIWFNCVRGIVFKIEAGTDARVCRRESPDGGGLRPTLQLLETLSNHNPHALTHYSYIASLAHVCNARTSFHIRCSMRYSLATGENTRETSEHGQIH